MTGHPLGTYLGSGALCLLLLGHACHPASAHADDLLAADKALHFGVSAGLAGTGYAGASLVLTEPWQRATAASLFTLTLGAGKELYDATGHGDASWGDMGWNVLGCATGVALSLLLDALLGPATRSDDPPGRTAPGAAPSGYAPAVPSATLPRWLPRAINPGNVSPGNVSPNRATRPAIPLP